jgi:diguanylate cyclase (GGDEF)-like protein
MAPAPLQNRKGSNVAADNPDAPKDAGPAVAPAAQLLAEIERLQRDLNRAERKIAELEARADIDPLLDILNRRGFERELARSLAYVKRYGTGAALMFIDLDGFKAVNDQYGHAAGDALLKAVAVELSAHVRASDVVARLGGDEFGVLMWNVDEAQAVAKATELEDIIARVRADYGPALLSVGASAGAVALLADATAAMIIDAADRTMYARKKGRKG